MENVYVCHLLAFSSGEKKVIWYVLLDERLFWSEPVNSFTTKFYLSFPFPTFFNRLAVGGEERCRKGGKPGVHMKSVRVLLARFHHLRKRGFAYKPWYRLWNRPSSQSTEAYTSCLRFAKHLGFLMMSSTHFCIL